MFDIFVSVPYTDDDPAIIESRVRAVEKYIAQLTLEGFTAYSTIAAMARIATEYNLSVEYSYWQEHCRKAISASRVFHILKLDGWDVSDGVNDETDFARQQGKTIYYISI